jgi:hypothetical protein
VLLVAIADSGYFIAMMVADKPEPTTANVIRLCPSIIWMIAIGWFGGIFKSEQN